MQEVKQETRVRKLVELLGGEAAGELAIGGVRVSELADRFGTPFYVYSGDVILRQVRRLRDALGADTSLFYSLKANPSLGICQLMAEHGLGAEVASIGELLLAQKAGFRADKTIFAGPGKTNEELALAARLGIRAVNVESEGELSRLARTAKAQGRVTGVGLRINPATQVRGAQMRMGGGAQQFGIDEEALAGVLARSAEHPHLDILGPHVYTGTQMFDVEALAEHFHHVVDLALAIADRTGRPVRLIDFGGGFGVPYFEGTPEFDLARFGALYRQVVARCRGDHRLSGAQLIVELGRYLVAESGVYVARVVDVKESRGRRFVIADGGMNHHITATGNFGQVFRKAYPVALLNRLEAQAAGAATIAGPCCTPLDIIAQNIQFPDAQVGDLVGIFYSGAYGYSASSLAFLSHPTPAEVLVWQGRVYPLRAAGRPEDVLQGQQGIV